MQEQFKDKNGNEFGEGDLIRYHRAYYSSTVDFIGLFVYTGKDYSGDTTTPTVCVISNEGLREAWNFPQDIEVITKKEALAEGLDIELVRDQLRGHLPVYEQIMDLGSRAKVADEMRSHSPFIANLRIDERDTDFTKIQRIAKFLGDDYKNGVIRPDYEVELMEATPAIAQQVGDATESSLPRRLGQFARNVLFGKVSEEPRPQQLPKSSSTNEPGGN